MKFLILFLYFGVFGAVTQSRTEQNHPESKIVRVILFFGDSVTAGYGLSPEEAYPALIQKKIDAEGLNYKVVNAGLSGDTTAAGVRRLQWALRQHVDILVLALGGNDGLRGIPPSTTKQNLQRMIDAARDTSPGITVVLTGMKMPPNYGPQFTKEFAAVFPALATRNKIPLVPFLLEGVGGIPAMNQPDLIHPTAQGQQLIAETVWATLKPMVE
jgi:acyl-CoA thioesterase I